MDDPVQLAKFLMPIYPELEWLTQSVNATPEGISQAGKSTSYKLFGTQHIEFDRTLAGINALRLVLKNDYDGFTKCQENPTTKLTPENFNHLKAYTEKVLKNPKDIDAMISYTVINDLGKIQSVVDNIQAKTGIQSVDHDDVLLHTLKHTPEGVPSFKRLSQPHQKTIVESLEPRFNIGQFLQAENLPANLSKLKGLSPKAMDYYLTHALYDIAGVVGHINPEGSKVMTNPLYNDFKQGIKFINQLSTGKSEVAVYNDFMAKKAKALQMAYKTQQDVTLAKLAFLSRVGTPEEANIVKNAFHALSDKEKSILTKHLTKDGINDKGILIYYAPALLNNLKVVPNKQPQQALEKGFSILAHIYQKAEEMTNNSKGVFTVSISNVAQKAKEESLSTDKIKLNSVGENAEAIISN